MPTPHDAGTGLRHGRGVTGPGHPPGDVSLLTDPAHDEAIGKSHERCAALGLSRIERPDYSPQPGPDLALALERNHRLFVHAVPVMELLLEQIKLSQSIVVLTDSQGTILHSAEHAAVGDRNSRAALAAGVNWSELSMGTNGMGTALIDEEPTLVHADEHFLHAYTELTCSAAPIFDPRGNALGVLDVTSDHRAYHAHTMGLVTISARMIENHWLVDDFRHALRLHFHSRPGFLGTLMEGIVAVGHDGRLLGANHRAFEQLRMSGPALRMNSIASVFGTTVAAVIDHFRSPGAMPMMLVLGNGEAVHVRAHFSWPSWYALGGFAGDASMFESPSAGPHSELSPVSEVARAAKQENALPARQAPRPRLDHLQTGDAHMEAVMGKIRRVLNRDIPVLILGETGTGKELLARAMHEDSERAQRAFVRVNCALLTEPLIEAELFGAPAGVSAGARRISGPGKIVQANGGTLFLDEIGDMPLQLQLWLLRLLQERRVTLPGCADSIDVDVAIVSATHANPREMIERHVLREDLYYRLSGLAVRLPALRDRSDLMTLVQKILRAECRGRTPGLDADVVRLFQRYHWPGNVRQLSNVLRSAAVMAADDGIITRAHLSDDLIEDAMRGEAPAPVQPAGDGLVAPPDATSVPAGAIAQPGAAATVGKPPGTLYDMALQAIVAAVQQAGGNVSVAAKRLGVSRNKIYRALRQSDRN
jgi:transcriptional regulator of acetoin/glycerol metabolism